MKLFERILTFLKIILSTYETIRAHMKPFEHKNVFITVNDLITMNYWR